MTNKQRTNGCCRRGSATIEFAVMLPLLLTIAFVCVDFGRFINSYVAVTNAAREGAYYASLHRVSTASRPSWEAAIRQTTEDEMSSNAWFDSSKITVPTPQSIDEGGNYRRVEVEVQYPFQTLINWPFIPGYNDELTLKRRVVMRGVR